MVTKTFALSFFKINFNYSLRISSYTPNPLISQSLHIYPSPLWHLPTNKNLKRNNKNRIKKKENSNKTINFKTNKKTKKSKNKPTTEKNLKGAVLCSLLCSLIFVQHYSQQPRKSPKCSPEKLWCLNTVGCPLHYLQKPWLSPWIKFNCTDCF